MLDDVTILAVDDDDMNLEMLDVMLSDMDCRIIKANNGQQALQVLNDNSAVDIMLIDLEMPVMDGYECIRHLKESFKWRDIPIIVVTAGSREVTRVLALGANDFISKPFNPEELRLRVMNHVRSKKLSDLAKDMNNILESEVVRKTAALQKALDLSREAEYEISLRLGRAAEFRDQDTGMHTRRISELSNRLGQMYGLPDHECEMLRFSSPLHDVGKIGIPDRILLKPGKLEEAEFEIMKLHTVIGGKILSEADRYPMLEAGHIIALQHHEKWDGTGYPEKLKGEDIHVFARIVSIVDVFDALTSDRPYKKTFPLDKTIAIMKEESGKLFDPSILALFLEHIGEFVAIKDSLRDMHGTEYSLEGHLQIH